MPKIKWEKEHVDLQQLLIEAYSPLLRVGPIFEMKGSVWNLPKVLPGLDEKGNQVGIITLTTYRQVYDFIDRSKDLALKHFQMLYGEIDA
jgi:hypothetical protein